MADETNSIKSAENIAESKPPTEPIKPYVFNEDAFRLKIATLEQSIQDKVGRPNYNPFLFEKSSGLKELISRFKLGERSKELFDSVASLPSEVPVLNPNYAEPKPDVAPLPKGLRPATK